MNPDSYFPSPGNPLRHLDCAICRQNRLCPTADALYYDKSKTDVIASVEENNQNTPVSSMNVYRNKKLKQRWLLAFKETNQNTHQKSILLWLVAAEVVTKITSYSPWSILDSASLFFPVPKDAERHWDVNLILFIVLGLCACGFPRHRCNVRCSYLLCN